MDAVAELHLPSLQPLSRTASRPEKHAERKNSSARRSIEALAPSPLVLGESAPGNKNSSKSPAKTPVKPQKPLTHFKSET
jgi:hypothetical protein